ncbi:hypothetical protein [Acidisoma sp. L85]|uniref:hypothetical protein n=1 Tax=Acidisoma sp. L85 TaxID=1641850 RepID=UPI00131CBA61|nr:hypothetical protein [Acidisoma sp. L85]
MEAAIGSAARWSKSSILEGAAALRQLIEWADRAFSATRLTIGTEKADHDRTSKPDFWLSTHFRVVLLAAEEGASYEAHMHGGVCVRSPREFIQTIKPALVRLKQGIRQEVWRDAS